MSGKSDDSASIFTKDYKADSVGGKSWKEGEP